MNANSEPERRPLKGVKVVETSSYLTGPFAGLNLADLGADVLKIEPEEGDGFRRFGHQRRKLSATWASSNRDKRSIFLNLKSEEGRQRALAEIRDADVLIGNWRPHVAESLGLGRDTLRALNPRLINLAISGFGESGQMAGKPTYDSLIQARTGLCTYGHPEGAPKLSPLWTVDKVVGIQAAQAVCAALYQRERTGVGCDIELSMLDVAAYFNMPEMMQTRVFEGDDAPPKVTPSTMFETADGHILICPVNGKQMSRTLDAIGKPEWKKEITSLDHPIERTEAFYTYVRKAIKTRTSLEWLETLEAYDVPCGPVWGMDEHLVDPAVAESEIYTMIGEPGDRMRAVRYPALFDGCKLKPRNAARRLESYSERIIEKATK